MTKLCGIYCIENTVNGKKYIGKSKDIYYRTDRHFSSLRCGTHYNLHLQRAWNKYGEENFSFYVLKCCSEDELSSQEQLFISKIGSKHPYGYNLTDGGDGGLGMTDESRKKISIANKGKEVKQSSKLLMSMNQTLHNSFKGKKHTPETLKILSTASIGNKHSIGKPNRQGRKPSSKSGFVGVRWAKTCWEARITINKKQISLGRYETDVLAAHVYDSYARMYYGDNAKTNF